MNPPPLYHDAALLTITPSSQLSQMSTYHIKKMFKILVFILKICRFQRHFSGKFNGWQNFFRDDLYEKNTAHQNIGLFLRYSAQTYSITVGGIILMAITSLVLLDQASLTNATAPLLKFLSGAEKQRVYQSLLRPLKTI